MGRPKKTKAIERLQKALDKIPELKHLQSDSQDFKKWRRDTRIAIANTFRNKSDHVGEFNNISFSLIALSTNTPRSKYQEAYEGGLESAASVLKSMIDEIEEYWEEDEELSHLSPTEVKTPRDANKVFVVHGRDESSREMVARLLEKLDLEPVILQEQPSKGRTIIEKFENHSNVGFAVVLLTPDDVGSLRDRPDDVKPRARQNVVFELGYFAAALGRERVCALVKGDVERPSDYDGVAYIPLGNRNGWEMKIVKELKAAGFDVDANKVI